VTGSARLDHYRKGGDSLANRYRYFRLHPFSWREWTEATGKRGKAELDALMRFGGFPEPLTAGSERTLRIWQRDRMSRVIRDDLGDLERVRDISFKTGNVAVMPFTGFCEQLGLP
jgi:predicted AAA+ superfamily ATPase